MGHGCPPSLPLCSRLRQPTDLLAGLEGAQSAVQLHDGRLLAVELDLRSVRATELRVGGGGGATLASGSPADRAGCAWLCLGEPSADCKLQARPHLFGLGGLDSLRRLEVLDSVLKRGSRRHFARALCGVLVPVPPLSLSSRALQRGVKLPPPPQFDLLNLKNATHFTFQTENSKIV